MDNNREDMKQYEALIILQEECAEVSVVVSKIKRFGISNVAMGSTDGLTNRDRLEAELGDVLAMIDILGELGVIDKDKLITYNKRKREKLKEWSTYLK